MQLYCPIRKIYVKALPEEQVRQRLIQHMIGNLNFPQALIAVEKELKTLPHLALNSTSIANRRADLICFGKEIHPKYPLFPLLLVECKAVKLTEKVINQVIGYNHHVNAYFIAIANQEEIKTGWFNGKDYTFVDTLPEYSYLKSMVSSNNS